MKNLYLALLLLFSLNGFSQSWTWNSVSTLCYGQSVWADDLGTFTEPDNLDYYTGEYYYYLTYNGSRISTINSTIGSIGYGESKTITLTVNMVTYWDEPDSDPYTDTRTSGKKFTVYRPYPAGFSLTESVDYLDNTPITLDNPNSCSSSTWEIDGAPTNAITGDCENGFSLNASIDLGEHTIEHITTTGTCSSGSWEDVWVDIKMLDFPEACINNKYLLDGYAKPAGGVWSGPEVTDGKYFEASSAGIKEVTYTDTVEENEEFYSNKMEIVVKPDPTLSISELGEKCQNAEIVDLSDYAASNGTLEYEGSFVNGSNFDPNNTPGDYKITFTATLNECSVDEEKTITILEIPEIELENIDPVCENGNNRTLSQHITKNTSTLTVWSNTQGVSGGVFNPNGLPPNTYKLKVTGYLDNGCSIVIDNSIEILEIPTISFEEINDLCPNTGSIDISSHLKQNGTSGYWTGAPDGLFLNNTGAGNYSVWYTAISDKGCKDSTKTIITVNPLPEITKGSYDNVLNTVDKVILNKELPIGGTYEGPTIYPNGNEFYPRIAQIGTHDINYIVTNEYSCTDTAIITIRVISKEVSLDAVGSTSSCVDGDSIKVIYSPTNGILQGSGLIGDYFYPSIVGAGTHKIWYTITDEYNNDYADTLYFNILPLPEKPEIENIDTICKGDEVTINLKNAGSNTVSWFFDNTNKNTTSLYINEVLENKNIRVRYQNIYGCINEESFTIPIDPIEASFTTSTDIVKKGDLVQFTSTSTNASYYYWNFFEGFNSTKKNPEHRYYTNDTYDVKLIATSEKGCTDTILKENAIVVNETGTTTVATINSWQDVFIYPLPMNNFLNIELPVAQNATISIHTITGAVVLQESISNKKNTIDVSTLKQGVYILSIETKEGIASSELIKK